MINGMDSQPIRTDADYEAALQAVSALVEFDPAPGTPQGEELKVLADLIARYEAEHFPIEKVCGGRKRISARIRQR
ncbi:hypothetical protein [Burkholderia cenocepacia]|uniref:hypothetical protein n=2 Tax=Burkholderiaceae TaxID=119060 RepID=UPI0009E0FBFA|nr:hypothetical protein [Burkholderia cenocepacia]ARF87011.1 helix-turn-helix motif-containing protein [Burkholderia cenocepacia]MDS0851764.1 hypothetical protein [Burkholderia cenocepacia]